MNKELMEQIAIKIYIVAMKNISGVLADTVGGYPEWHQASKQNKSFYLEQAEAILPIVDSQVQAEKDRVIKGMVTDLESYVKSFSDFWLEEADLESTNS